MATQQDNANRALDATRHEIAHRRVNEALADLLRAFDLGQLHYAKLYAEELHAALETLIECGGAR